MDQKTIKFLVRLFYIISFLFGLFSFFIITVKLNIVPIQNSQEWTTSALKISLCNCVLSLSMAVMNSLYLDRLGGR